MSGSTWAMQPGSPLRGAVRVPGDKSVSHRAILLNALATGPAKVRGLLHAEDVQRTVRAVRKMGVDVSKQGTDVIVTPPKAGLQEPDDVIDCGNSGTTIRLLAGVCAARSGLTVLTGDESLRRRPMDRIAEPLRRMGAVVDGRGNGRLAPLIIRGGSLSMNQFKLQVASAQVKSCLLLAGLSCGVAVREPARSRDHTERMLLAMGAPLRRAEDDWWMLMPTNKLAPLDIEVPGDLSSAAFWLVAAAIVPGSEVFVKGVGVNPTRSGVLDVLQAMGADIQVYPQKSDGAEPVADVLVRAGPLVGTQITGDLALRALDELPALAVAAAFADGETVISDAAELRVKESDRIAEVARGLRSLGIAVEEKSDGMVIQGGKPRGPTHVDAHGDHRIAMAFAIAGLAAPGGTEISGAESVLTSYPEFLPHLEALRARA